MQTIHFHPHAAQQPETETTCQRLEGKCAIVGVGLGLVLGKIIASTCAICLPVATFSAMMILIGLGKGIAFLSK